MFNKLNTKYLFILFGILLALVLIAMPGKNNKKNRSFKSELTNFDSSEITSLLIYPKAGGELVTLEKKEDKWMVTNKEGSYNADVNQVKNMLGTLTTLKAKRLAGRGKDKWADFEVTDSLGTRVKVLEGKKILANIYLGKFSYKQAPQNENPYAQRQQAIMTSFVRLSDEKDIYAVDGFLSMTFNRAADDFRDRKIASINKNNLVKLSFSQANGNFNLVKQGNTWMLDGLAADSASVAKYISSFNNLSGSGFLSENNKPLGKPTHTLSIEADNLNSPVKLHGYYTDSTNIAIVSSENLGTYFDGTKSELFDKIFCTKESLLTPE